MYITASTYGGIDWHDSHTIHEQLGSGGSYNIEEDLIPEAIADHIVRSFPYVENLREQVIQALSERSCFQFDIKDTETDSAGNVTYRDCAAYEADGRVYFEKEAVFDGCGQKLTWHYAFGQVSYTTSYYVVEIPDDQLGYIVTEDFLAPSKGIPVVQRLYHDIFDDQDAAKSYAENLKLHGFTYPKSIATFLVCNKRDVIQEEWYRRQKEAMRLMEEKGQSYLDDSFHIFINCHIENLKKLSGKETI